MACSAEGKPIFVKIGRESGVVKEYAFRPGTVYSDVLKIAGIHINSEIEAFILNGVGRDLGILSNFALDKDVIILRPKEIGMIIKIGRVGQPLMTLKVDKNSTVRMCLVVAGITVNETEDVWLHVNDRSPGTKAAMERCMSNGEFIIIEKKKDPKREMIASILGDFYEENMCSECGIIGGLDIRELGSWVERILEIK